VRWIRIGAGINAIGDADLADLNGDFADRSEGRDESPHYDEP